VKNKYEGSTVIFGLIVLVIIAAIAGSVLLRIVKPDAEATFINFVTLMFGFITTMVGILFVKKSNENKIEEQNEDIALIKRNTNGTLSAKDAQIKAYRAELARRGINPDTLVPHSRAESLAAEEARG
jgi:hypothetical protein